MHGRGFPIERTLRPVQRLRAERKNVAVVRPVGEHRDRHSDRHVEQGQRDAPPPPQRCRCWIAYGGRQDPSSARITRYHRSKHAARVVPGNFSSSSRKHLSNQSLGLRFDSNPGSHFMLYFSGLSIFCHLDSSDSYHLSRGRSIDLKLHTRGSMSTLPHELTIGIACLEDRIEPVKRLLRSPAKTCPSATGQPQPQGSDRSGIDNRSLRPSVTVCRTP